MIDDKKREEIEQLIYSVFDAADKTGTNTEYYRNIFLKMSTPEFFKFISRRLPFRLHVDAFNVEPSMNDAFDAFKVLNKPLLEKVKLPYLFNNKDGKPVESKEALVIYINIKRMKQMLSKKNSTAINISQRDMRTGLLLNEDKGGKMSDKEFESSSALSLEYTMDEFSRVRADAMEAKNKAYNIINVKGEVSMDEIDVEKTDSLAKNMLNVYMIGANIHSNLIDDEYYTPYTLKHKHAQANTIQRS